VLITAFVHFQFQKFGELSQRDSFSRIACAKSRNELFYFHVIVLHKVWDPGHDGFKRIVVVVGYFLDLREEVQVVQLTQLVSVQESYEPLQVISSNIAVYFRQHLEQVWRSDGP